ncbi:type I-E CRISPR-associated protein Cse2/CasB [Nonomuraea sp. bgisy101]|uniref:type I-E CRISPR-associated protein Cse2/CasB n=1 Tax=Nonomuraea sp. bgisy101 TaxID=3413784 RepID=UPI003D730F16
MTTVAPSTRPSAAQVVQTVAGDFIIDLQKGYLADQSWAVALLARLRRGAGKLPQDVPDLWGMTGTDRLYEHDLSEADMVRAETALFVTVTLYALHQQSRTDKGMHRRNIELGEAVRRLMPRGEIDEPIRRRFVRVGTAGTRQTLAHRLREIVSLLRGESISLDYARLAGQLYQAQHPDGMRQVRQSWGRSFHAYRPPASSSTGDTTPGDTTIQPTVIPTEKDSR